jgi:hypothetical protein
MSARFFGVDGEMSSSDLDKGGRLIQIGVTAHTNIDGTLTKGDDAFCTLLNPGPNTWSAIAEGVHGFTPADVNQATPATVVDDLLVRWLLDRGADRKRRVNTIPLGFNVGAFDMPHIAAVLPKTSALFSRRTIDLNAVCFTLDGAEYGGSARSWDEWKALASTYAERTIAGLGSRGDVQAHDAGYDALLHLHAWRFLRGFAHGAPFSMPSNEVAAPASKTRALALIAAHGTAGAAKFTGIPEEFLVQWSRGGRAAHLGHLAALDQAFQLLA